MFEVEKGQMKENPVDSVKCLTIATNFEGNASWLVGKTGIL